MWLYFVSKIRNVANKTKKNGRIYIFFIEVSEKFHTFVPYVQK
jgi:hypothetical protein